MPSKAQPSTVACHRTYVIAFNALTPLADMSVRAAIDDGRTLVFTTLGDDLEFARHDPFVQ